MIGVDKRMASNSKDRYLINSILRASNVLRCFLGEKSHFKISELARQLKLDRSTTYRILLSLEKCGLVEKDKKTGEYSLGLSTFEIGNTYLRRMDFIKVSKPDYDGAGFEGSGNSPSCCPE